MKKINKSNIIILLIMSISILSLTSITYAKFVYQQNIQNTITVPEYNHCIANGITNLSDCILVNEDDYLTVDAAKSAIALKNVDYTTPSTSDEGLLKETDNHGDTYYFRGLVEDNYIIFANHTWRIVRINGDGSTRIIYAGTTPRATGANTTIGLVKYNDTTDVDMAYVGYKYGLEKSYKATTLVTYDNIDEDNIYVSTNLQYLPLVYEQLPQVNDMHILEEPLRRGTLASVAWGMSMILQRDPHARVLVTPSDQLIVQESDYKNDMLDGLDFVAEHENLLVMGVKATRPETGYGYIQRGAEIGEKGINKVKTFTEKPAPSFAEMFVSEGDFLWNTGLQVFRADVFLDTVCRLLPEYQVAVPRMMADAESDDAKLVPEIFQMLPNLSLAEGLLERANNVCVKECSFGWADIGTWASIHDDLPSDERGNVLMNTKAFLYECSDNVIRLPNGKKAVIKGLSDYVVAEEGDILMICPRKDAATMRRMHTDTKFM
jgi:mannose-1-phosphate guanylyltransferase